MNQKKLELIKELITRKIDPSFIVLFGSQATETTHSESDIDIAFYKPSHGLSAYDVFALAQELASLVKIEVDLVDLDKASTVFKAQIFAIGIPIYISNQVEFDNYRMVAMSMYTNLNVERKEIMKSIIESGTVYDYKK